MTQEVLEQQVAEPTADDLRNAEQAAFEAVFSAGSAEEAPAAESPAEENKPELDESSVEVSEGDATEEPEEELGIPAAKVREYLAEVEDFKQHRDRLYGMVGSLKQQLQQVSERAQQQVQPSGVKFSAESLKRMRSEYPELADLLAEDLSEAISVGGNVPSPVFDPSQLAPLFEQREAALTDRLQRQYEAKLLTLAHPDWQEVAQSADFKLWKGMLAPELRDRLDSSVDSYEISQGLSAFKDWKEQQVHRNVSKKQRLERAVQPSGVPATSDTATEYDDFLSGFAKVRGTS